jgi:hypothetical protein
MIGLYLQVYKLKIKKKFFYSFNKIILKYITALRIVSEDPTIKINIFIFILVSCGLPDFLILFNF